MQPELESLIHQFKIIGTPVCCVGHGNGHINETYRVECDNGRWYTLQQVNTDVFREPVLLMRNVQAVTAHVARKVENPREVLCLIPTKEDTAFVVDEKGRYWRMFAFVRDSVCLDRAETPAQFYESAVAFGRFMNLLADFPAEELSETIPHFHDTPARYAALKEAAAKDPLGRAKEVRRELDFAFAREDFTHMLTGRQSVGLLPLRVTHNDTKINNVLFDRESLTGLCVIDLDTVMPGLADNDFGDAIRYGANCAAEDETDLSNVGINLTLYEAYVRGYLHACGKVLTREEIAMLPVGAEMMTFECGMRFLTDYLLGDTYFRIHRPLQNLDRCRCQFALLADMERQFHKLEQITSSIG